MSVDRVTASSTCSIASSMLPPPAPMRDATEVASTLMTAMAGVSGPAEAGGKPVVSATINPAIAAPTSSAANPSDNPDCNSPWNSSAANEMQ